MRFTHIYFRRFSKVGLLAAGIFGGAAVAGYMQQPEPVKQTDTIVSESPIVSDPLPSFSSSSDKKDLPLTVAEKFQGFVLDGVAADSSGQVIYASVASNEKRHNIDGLRAQGYVVKMVNKCEILIMNQDRSEQTRLYTSYCGPEKPPVTPPMMSSEERYKWKLEQVRAAERLSHNSY